MLNTSFSFCSTTSSKNLFLAVLPQRCTIPAKLLVPTCCPWHAGNHTFTCSELRMEADVSALSYEGFSQPAPLISSPPVAPDFCSTLARRFPEPAEKNSLWKMTSEKKLKEKKKSQKRGEKTARGEQIRLTWRLNWPEFKQAKHTWVVTKASLHYTACLHLSLTFHAECLYRWAHWDWIKWACLKDHWANTEKTHWLINAWTQTVKCPQCSANQSWFFSTVTAALSLALESEPSRVPLLPFKIFYFPPSFHRWLSSYQPPADLTASRQCH